MTGPRCWRRRNRSSPSPYWVGFATPRKSRCASSTSSPPVPSPTSSTTSEALRWRGNQESPIGAFVPARGRYSALDFGDPLGGARSHVFGGAASRPCPPDLAHWRASQHQGRRAHRCEHLVAGAGRVDRRPGFEPAGNPAAGLASFGYRPHLSTCPCGLRRVLSPDERKRRAWHMPRQRRSFPSGGSRRRLLVEPRPRTWATVLGERTPTDLRLTPSLLSGRRATRAAGIYPFCPGGDPLPAARWIASADGGLVSVEGPS